MNLKEMTFFEHLSELRKRIIIIVCSIILFSIIGYYYSEIIINFLIQSVDSSSSTFQVLHITSLFMIKINIAIFSGLFFSFPVIIYQFLIFLKPAFADNINFTKIILFISLSIFLFISGILFGYKILIPLTIYFFNNISLNLNELIHLNYTLENYLIYLIWILIISSLIYQIPILLIILVKINIVSLKFLKKNRPYIILLFFIISALLTPPDPISQIIVALPLIMLYEFTILIIYLLYRSK